MTYIRKETRSKLPTSDPFEAFVKKASAESGSSARRKHSSGEIHRSATAGSSSLAATAAAARHRNTTTVAAVRPVHSALGALQMAPRRKLGHAEGAEPSPVQLNPSFLSGAPAWFRHVIGGSDGRHDKHANGMLCLEMTLESWSSAGSVLVELGAALKRLLGAETDVAAFEAEADPLNPAQPLHRLVQLPALRGKRASALVAHSFALWKETLRYEERPRDDPVPHPLKALLTPPSGKIVQLFGPRLPESGFGFIPRQRLLLVESKERSLKVWGYNWLPSLATDIHKTLLSLVCWYNARSRLARMICLQKQGLHHLAHPTAAEMGSNPYLSMCWTDPEVLVASAVPPDRPVRTDFGRLHPVFARLLVPWDYVQPSLTRTLHPDSQWTDREAQDLISARRRMRERLEVDVCLGRLLETWAAEECPSPASPRDSPPGSPDRRPLLTVDETSLGHLVARSRLAHYVYTPLLFSPIWRERVAQIRRPTATHSSSSAGIVELGELSSAALTGSSATLAQPPPTGGHQRKLSSTATQRSRQSSTSAKGGLEEDDRSTHLMDSGDAWHFQLQHLLMKEYTQYLESLGLRTLKIQMDSAPGPSGAGGTSRGADPGTRDPLAPFDSFGPAVSPEVWLLSAHASGLILLHLSFAKPYFALKFYAWNPVPQLPESLLPEATKQLGERCGPELNGRLLELVSRSHVHSFSYDFHLKMVVAYLSEEGSREVMFRPGYHMNAFLLDFLQYYHCRPAFARNSLYEDELRLGSLLVTGSALYNHLLNHDRAYSLRVVRMKVPSSKEGAEVVGGKSGQVPKSIDPSPPPPPPARVPHAFVRTPPQDAVSDQSLPPNCFID